jgi:hypothetical protein
MTNKDYSVPTTAQRDLLESLLAQIERAWFDRGERVNVEQLISEHPDLANELREFSRALFESDDAGGVEPVFLQAEKVVHDWLQNTGINEALIAAAAARRESNRTDATDVPRAAGGKLDSSSEPLGKPLPEPWIKFLHHRTGRQRAEIVSLLPNVTLEFLALVSRYPQVIPHPVKATLADSVEKCFGIPIEESLECLSAASLPMKRAASRRTPVDRAPETFEEVLDRAAFDKTLRAFWASRGRGST